jgi:hypothetical protein
MLVARADMPRGWARYKRGDVLTLISMVKENPTGLQWNAMDDDYNMGGARCAYHRRFNKPA